MSHRLSKTVNLTILILYKSFFVKLMVTFVTIGDYYHLKQPDFMVKEIKIVSLYTIFFRNERTNIASTLRLYFFKYQTS